MPVLKHDSPKISRKYRLIAGREICSLPAALQALCLAVGIVIHLIWAIMPLLVRILSPWLQRSLNRVG